MKDFDRYSREYYLQTKSFKIKNVIKNYQLPNSDELHTMICGYENCGNYDDLWLFDSAESLDYDLYEKEIWKLKSKQ